MSTNESYIDAQLDLIYQRATQKRAGNLPTKRQAMDNSATRIPLAKPKVDAGQLPLQNPVRGHTESMGSGVSLIRLVEAKKERDKENIRYNSRSVLNGNGQRRSISPNLDGRSKSRARRQLDKLNKFAKLLKKREDLPLREAFTKWRTLEFALFPKLAYQSTCKFNVHLKELREDELRKGRSNYFRADLVIVGAIFQRNWQQVMAKAFYKWQFNAKSIDRQPESVVRTTPGPSARLMIAARMLKGVCQAVLGRNIRQSFGLLRQFNLQHKTARNSMRRRSMQSFIVEFDYEQEQKKKFTVLLHSTVQRLRVNQARYALDRMKVYAKLGEIYMVHEQIVKRKSLSDLSAIIAGRGKSPLQRGSQTNSAMTTRRESITEQNEDRIVRPAQVRKKNSLTIDPEKKQKMLQIINDRTQRYVQGMCAQFNLRYQSDELDKVTALAKNFCLESILDVIAVLHR
jgi:hypothetical protein